MTQQNAALVEEATAASKAMEHQTESLIREMSFFRVPRSQSHAVARKEAVRQLDDEAMPPLALAS